MSTGRNRVLSSGARLAGRRRLGVDGQVKVRVRLLGEVVALDAAGEILDVGPAKCRTLLAALAASVGNPVPTWRLVELIWGDDPPRTAERTLQSYIARLRKSMGPDSIERTGAAYRLDLPSEAVDVSRFEARLAAGDRDGALAEWTGAPLAGLDAPGLGPWAAGLTERWLGAVEQDLTHRVEQDPSSVVGRLTELTATHPFRERLWALLMTALYRVGRQADALAAYRSARAQLVGELGVEPGPELQALEMSILDHDPVLAPASSPTRKNGSRLEGTVTFVITDVEGSARWWAEDADAMGRAMRRHHEVVTDAAGRHGAHLFSVGGDSFSLVFAGAKGAIAAASEIQEATRTESWPSPIDLRVRIGVHTGETESSELGYFGPAVNLATQLAAAGHGGQTLVSGTTAGMIGTEGLRELGSFRLSGVVAMQSIFQVGEASFPPLRLEGRQRGNLPRRLGRLIGRDDELDAIDAALSAYPVVTLIGPGGIGKTRIALSSAARALEGREAWFVDLTEVDSSDQVPRAVADVLGVTDIPGGSLPNAIANAVSSRRMLIVLDNCEHVLDGAAAIARTITGRCEGVSVLATSRERLGLSNERIVGVPPLDVDAAAVDLFDERAAQAVGDLHDPDAERGAVRRICRRLDGIPLAVELAAARVATMSPVELADRLDRDLRILDSGRKSPHRHHTLRRAVEWSYDLLEPPERRLFRELSVFAGGFDLAGAEAISPPTAASADALLGGLVGRSMVTVESGPFGRRYRMLEPIRQFAAELREASEEDHLARERHLGWCLSAVERIRSRLSGWDEGEGVGRLAELVPNIRVALDWAIREQRLDLALDLVRPVVNEIMLRSHTELGDWLERIAQAAQPADVDLRVQAIAWASHRYTVTNDQEGFERMVTRLGEPDHVLIRHARAFATSDYASLLRWSPEAAADLRARGWEQIAHRYDIDVGAALLNLGRFEEHDEHVTALADRFRVSGPPTLVNWTLMLLGYSASFQGRQDIADEYFEEAIAADLPVRTHTPTGPLAARAAFRRGNRLRAYELLADHITELLETDNIQAASIDCIEFVNMMAAVGELEPAARILSYLDTTGLLDNPAWRTLIAAASDTVAAGVTHDVAVPATGRDALTLMQETLSELG